MPEYASAQCFVIEYENGIAYLVDVDGRTMRIPLEHGAFITVETYIPPAQRSVVPHTRECSRDQR